LKTAAIIDSHCHLDFPDYDQDREQVLDNARKLGVRGFIVPGTTARRWPKIIKLCRGHADVFGALGLHPFFLDEHGMADMEKLGSCLENRKIIAVGEIGLDFMHRDLDPERQLSFFKAQLKLAAEQELPVILHCRKAHDTVLKLLKRYPPKGGIAHAFNGSLQQAEAYIRLGFCLGFGGMLTYERSTKLRRLAQQLPVESLVLETDAPGMSGTAHRGQRNSPEYLPEVLQTLAELKNLSTEDLARQTTANVRRTLALPDAESGTGQNGQIEPPRGFQITS